jgi:hypothetical protein
MTTLLYALAIICGTVIVLAAFDTLDKIFGKNNKDKGDIE